MTAKRPTARHFILLSVLLVLAFLLSLSLGYAHSSFGDVLQVFLGQADPTTSLIVLDIRLPRILACLLGGASLALAGVLLQTLTRNPLADSGILGINTGAGLVIALMIGLLDTNHPLVIALMPCFAMLGGMLTICIVYLVSYRKNQPINPTRLIIAGVGISSLLSGVMVAVMDQLDPNETDYIVSWLSGKVTGGNWQTLIILAPLLILIWLATYSRSYALNIMTLNEESALALGLHLKRERFYILVLATALAAISVVLVGNITFVGLLAGHITRRFLGSDHRVSLPASMIMGMLLLLIADTLGRIFLVGTGIPTGIVIAIIGAPYFLYLMSKTA